MLAWSPGPPAIGDTGDNSPGHMMGTTWLLQVCPDGSWVLYREERGRLEVIPWDDPPDLVTPTARHISLCFDQAARVVLAWEDQGVIRVRRWDIEQNQYIENVSFAGVDPVVVFDASWAYQIPGSDVLLFYLSPDRQRVLCRVQRDVYAVEHEIWAYSGAGGDYQYEVFTESGTWDWEAAGQPSEVDVLVVAGGGGGGSRQGAGGGAGGVLVQTGVVVNESVAVTVGAGGQGNLGGGRGATGQNSSFGTITAVGGGGGGGRNTDQDGASGGSGGGAAGGSQNPGSATSGQGNVGGAANPQTINSAGGGGGASAPGESALDIFPQELNEAGDGGDGVTLSSLGWEAAVAVGAPVAVGGGGGGGVNSTGVSAGVGGIGGGGDGQLGTTTGYPTGGAPNTGGGGGGSGLDTIRGGDGGSGLVVVRWGSETEAEPVILDRVIALPYRYQVLVSDASGAPLPSVLVSDLYPVAVATGVRLEPEFLEGEYRQVAYRYSPPLGVELTPEFVGGALTLPVTTYSPLVGVELVPAFHAGELKSVVTQYQPELGVELEPEFHEGALDEIGVQYTPTLGVELTPEFIGGVYEPG